MSEYIKREDALDAVLFALVGTGHQSNAIYAIRDIPTADVVEVRHGYWKVCGAFDDFLKCSLCHSDYPWMQVSHHNYCPNCGADMRGIKNDKE